jgi:hypothetical protein
LHISIASRHGLTARVLAKLFFKRDDESYKNADYLSSVKFVAAHRFSLVEENLESTQKKLR